MCLFCGCNVVVARSRERIPRYLDALEAEGTLKERMEDVDDDGQTYLFYQGNPDRGKSWYLTRVRIGWKNDTTP